MHPTIEAIPNWRLKVQLADPEQRKQWLNTPEHERMGRFDLTKCLHFATTYGLPIYNSKTGFHEAAKDRNEFWDNPALLELLDA